MSDGRSSMSSDSEKLFQNIGERLKRQRQMEEETEKDEEAGSESRSEDKDEGRREKIEDKDSSAKAEKEDQDKTDSSQEKKHPERSWQRREVYQTSFKVKPDMEDNFNDCKRKFRRELNILLSKQDAIELGWLLLKNLDETYFEELRVSHSPDDDLIQALKELIEEYY